MIAGIVTALLPFLIKVLGMWLDKVGADAESVKKFWGWVDSLDPRLLQSARIRESAKAQLARLQQEEGSDEKR